jgi:hypothetical protein
MGRLTVGESGSAVVLITNNGVRAHLSPPSSEPLLFGTAARCGPAAVTANPRLRQSRMQAPVARFRGPIVQTNRKHPLRPMSMFLLLVLLISLVTAGCGNYSSQAVKYLTQARSQVLGSAYTLEQLGEGELRPDEPSTVYLGHAENWANP